MFNEFCIPTLNLLSEGYGGIGVHCCADSKLHWEDFLKIDNMKYLNICQPVNVIKESLSVFENKVAQMPFAAEDSNNSGDWYKDVCPKNTHVVLQYGAKDKDEALLKLEQANKLKKEY